jgi:hypothetical protein
MSTLLFTHCDNELKTIAPLFDKYINIAPITVFAKTGYSGYINKLDNSNSMFTIIPKG